MEVEEIQKIIYESVCYIQELSGRASPPEFSDTLIPIGQVEGFDSLNGSEVSTILADKFGCKLSENPFASEYCALTINQIAKNIYTKLH
jgi:acyl carrier protein